MVGPAAGETRSTISEGKAAASASGEGPERLLIEVLLTRYGQTLAGEIGLDLKQETPSPLFRWLCASLLFDRAPPEAAAGAARALTKAGWTTARKMAACSAEDRRQVLEEAGCAEADAAELSRLMGLAAERLLERWKGDLRRLRQEAGRDGAQERAILEEILCDENGKVARGGVLIFCREMQTSWNELHPCADPDSLEAAADLGLPRDAAGLAALVDDKELARLLAACLRARAAGALDEVRAAANAGNRRDGATSPGP